jgi:hypothetical protein
MASVKTSVMRFARMMGRAPRSSPYTNQRNTPIVKVNNIPNDTSCAERVRQVCWSCGIKAIVVRVPASKPTSVTISIGEVSAKVTGLTQEGGYPQRRIHPDSLS